MKSSNVAAFLLGLSPLAVIAQSTTMAALRHVSRPVLIFGGENDPRVAEQLQKFALNAAAVRERDIRVVLVPAQNVKPERTGGLDIVSLSDTEQQKVREKFGVKTGSFAVVLVGKDGGRKLRSNESLPWESFVEAVDSMPMRREEVNSK